MELDNKLEAKREANSLKTELWNFQGIFNTIFTIFFILSSVGLWACLVEINKLKQSTNVLVETISLMGGISQHGNVQDLYTVFPKLFNNGYRRSNIDEHNYAEKLTNSESVGDSVRHFDKRAAIPTHMTYDPLSPQKDLTEYCMTLLYDKCGTNLPGAPAVGPPGPPGPPGDIGVQGRPGVMGHMGPPGVNGQKGHRGDTGDTGRIGEAGADGPRGPPGFPGVNGIQGGNGRRGKRGLPGRPGKSGKDGTPGMPGQKGEQGDPGDPGGTVSLKGGNCSCTGIKGEKGQRGLVGFSGYKGEKGDAGLKGEKGYGMQGFPGPKGPEGPKGAKGDPGFCRASHCGDKYVRRKATEQNFDSYTVQEETTRQMTTSTTTLPPTTPSTIPPIIEPKTTVCRLKRIATPVFIKRESSLYGSILGDPINPGKFWLTRDYHGQFLEQYNSIERLKKRLIDITFNMQINRYFGTHHAVYNNSFYYQFTGKQHVVRYDLALHDVVTATNPIPGSHFNDSSYLYKDSKTYYDITADENGLWIVYGRARGTTSYIHVMKADIETLEVIKVWKLPVEIGVYKNGFIACGILYLVKDLRPDHTETEIDFAYDLYSDEYTAVNISLKIPYGKSTMFTFYTNTSERRKSVLLAWDSGNIIKYLLLF